MTARRVVATTFFLVAVGFVWIGALTPLRADDIASFDDEAQRLAEDWRDASENLLDGGDEADRLLRESNAAYEAARALEPPLGPVQAAGFALLAAAGGVALWPNRTPGADDAQDAPDER